MSKSVLSKGLAILAAWVAASAMVSGVRGRPIRSLAASVATIGREAAGPITMRGPSRIPALGPDGTLDGMPDGMPDGGPEMDKRMAAATERTGKSKEPRRRSFQ